MSLLNGVCDIRRCPKPARWRVEINGHPNGDAAGDYCHAHAKEKAGSLWDESPMPYTITVLGPFNPHPV